ncbi:SpoIIE family protein phosphatase [Streptomyces sp. NPDC058914]|uniref:SpoIIE family protein phosphatase n=1 Tax=Streptomyces sp. NPDC058914 TaxID=3346671 RepID=UPI0036A1084C
MAEQARKAHEALLKHGRGAMATRQLLCIRLEEERIQLINAGHPRPMRLLDGTVEEIRLSVNLPFGIASSVPYLVQEFDLRPGDRLVGVATDAAGGHERTGDGELGRFAAGRRGQQLVPDLRGQCHGGGALAPLVDGVGQCHLQDTDAVTAVRHRGDDPVPALPRPVRAAAAACAAPGRRCCLARGGIARQAGSTAPSSTATATCSRSSTPPNGNPPPRSPGPGPRSASPRSRPTSPTHTPATPGSSTRPSAWSADWPS